MSPNVGNFVHDLVEMAKAMEILPQVEARVRELEARLDHANETIQARELSIISYKSELDGLYAKVRTVEAERDDAEIRFLELDEKLHMVNSNAVGLQEILAKQIELTSPPKPQPEPVVEAISNFAKEPWAGQVVEPNLYPHAGHGYDEPQGQGEGDPTVQSETGKSQTVTSGETHLETASGVQITDAALQPEPAPGLYTNKLYHDHPVYVHRHDWIEGGGTEESYHWRPDVA